MFDEYIMPLIRYSFMRYYLTGNYLCSKCDSTEEIIKFVPVFSKAIKHDKNFMLKALDYVKENYFDNIEFAQTIM